jgi:hypothetical protein
MCSNFVCVSLNRNNGSHFVCGVCVVAKNTNNVHRTVYVVVSRFTSGLFPISMFERKLSTTASGIHRKTSLSPSVKRFSCPLPPSLFHFHQATWEKAKR